MLEPSWVGRRVSVRQATGRGADGRLTTVDVVGDLLAVHARTAVLETRRGLVEVPVELVVAARRVPASTADELALEAVAARGVRPAETEQLGGWLLRADHGLLRRANSVLPVRQLGMPTDDALEQARTWYADRGLPLLIATMAEARLLLDNNLGERGFEPVAEALVLTARTDCLASSDPDPRVELADAASEQWLMLYRGGELSSAAGRALLARHDTVVFASVVESGRTLATGRAVVDDGWLGVSAVEVAPAARRQGLARAIMSGLVAWGTALGATRSYLQVEADNTAALGLYDALGYGIHHRYRYRVAPPVGYEPTRPW